MRMFFDSSAFAKRYVREEGSEDVLFWCDRATELALAVIALPEIISAFCRLQRENRITEGQSSTGVRGPRTRSTIEFMQVTDGQEPVKLP